MEVVSPQIRGLALSILLQAVADLEKSRARDWRTNASCLRVYPWFFTDSDAWIFSFGNVCTLLGLHPVAVREALGLNESEAQRHARRA